MQWVVVYLFMCLFFLFRDWFGPLSCDDRRLLKCSVSLVSGLARPRIWMIFWPLNYICGVCMHNVHSGYLECVKALIKAKGDMCLFSAVGVFTRRALLSLLLCFCLRSYLPSCLWVGVCIASFCQNVYFSHTYIALFSCSPVQVSMLLYFVIVEFILHSFSSFQCLFELFYSAMLCSIRMSVRRDGLGCGSPIRAQAHHRVPRLTNEDCARYYGHI